MGNEASRICSPLRKLSAIQKLSGGSTAKMDHIKAKGFEQLVPQGPCGTSSSSDAKPVTEVKADTCVDNDFDATTPFSCSEAAGQDVIPVSAKATLNDVIPGLCLSQSESENMQDHKSNKSQGSKAKSQGSQQRSEDGKDNSQEEPLLLPFPLQPHKNNREVRGDGETKKIRRSVEGNHAGARHSTASGGRSSRFTNSASVKADGPVGKPFPKRPIGCKLSAQAWAKLEELFRLMDQDGSNVVTREEARNFFRGAFSNLSADAMFNEVDTDGNGAISSEEFAKFWIQVRGSGYKEQGILEELDELIEGGAWVDWKDGRDTVSHEIKFPKRPLMSRLSAKGWAKCEELFHKISGNDDKMMITREKAQHFFKGAFSNISTDAMFNEIDVQHVGVITPKEFMRFWVQLRSHGYKEKDILEEMDSLMEGNVWVDWKDGRNT